MLNYNSERFFLATTDATVFEFEIHLMAFAEAFAETAHRTVRDNSGFGERSADSVENCRTLRIIRSKAIKNYIKNNKGNVKDGNFDVLMILIAKNSFRLHIGAKCVILISDKNFVKIRL